MSAHEQLPLDLPVSQRWRHRQHTWRPVHEGGFDRTRYGVRLMEGREARAAKEFTLTHHYSASWPAVRFAFGLFDLQARTDRLVGVLALGVPMSVRVLTRVFPDLVPYQASLELSRLVLLDEVASNGETFLAGKAFRLAAERGVRGIVAHSDPQPRVRVTDNGPQTVLPGHTGCVYQAKGMHYLGRTTPRTLVMLPDASILTARALSKVRSDERGHAGVERRLQALGARPRGRGEPGGSWLAEVLDVIGARRVALRGNHRYAVALGRRGRVHGTSLPYPKQHEGGSAVV
ncbi:Mom family adenine methylcarbamoylation protein (plasmid) [Streptomyces sp. SDT5-1]|uniref:Mom family adenine methylcarbamoylation protein n=1 Tax=Streptomyces sp. SDT5-1 TaxID=3406418 RepID=UPI003FD3CD3F